MTYAEILKAKKASVATDAALTKTIAKALGALEFENEAQAKFAFGVVLKVFRFYRDFNWAAEAALREQKIYPTIRAAELTGVARDWGLSTWSDVGEDNDVDRIYNLLCDKEILSSIIPRKGEGKTRGIGRLLAPHGHWEGRRKRSETAQELAEFLLGLKKLPFKVKKAK